MRQIITIFLDYAPERVRETIAGAEAGDASRVRQAAHSIRSSSAYLGATRMRQVLERLERDAEGGSLEAVNALIPELSDAWQATETALRLRLDRSEQEGS